MSILNCFTRLTIVNCTGLTAVFNIEPEDSTMRIQPVGSAHVNATVGTSAESMSDWIHEWFNLLSYGPTYREMSWEISPSSAETTRFQLSSSIKVSVHWGDPSVSWETHMDGQWNIDISKAIDVTLFLKCDIGQYSKRQGQMGRPSEISAVHLLPYLEIACDDEIPFVIKEKPIAQMFWRPGINIEHIVKPES